MNNKILIGCLEYCDLPDLGITQLAIRVDTGATTSSLHVDNIEEFEKGEDTWIRFDIHPDVHDVEKLKRCEAKITGKKRVKSSTATLQKRYVISTDIMIADQRWPIKLTLTDRSEMNYLMLFGREAMSGRFIVDPELEHVVSQ